MYLSTNEDHARRISDRRKTFTWIDVIFLPVDYRESAESTSWSVEHRDGSTLEYISVSYGSRNERWSVGLQTTVMQPVRRVRGCAR